MMGLTSKCIYMGPGGVIGIMHDWQRSSALMGPVSHMSHTPNQHMCGALEWMQHCHVHRDSRD